MEEFDFEKFVDEPRKLLKVPISTGSPQEKLRRAVLFSHLSVVHTLSHQVFLKGLYQAVELIQNDDTDGAIKLVESVTDEVTTVMSNYLTFVLSVAMSYCEGAGVSEAIIDLTKDMPDRAPYSTEEVMNDDTNFKMVAKNLEATPELIPLSMDQIMSMAKEMLNMCKEEDGDED